MRWIVLLLMGCGGPVDAPMDSAAESSVTTASTSTGATAGTTTSTYTPYTTTWACRDDIDSALLNGTYPESELPLVPFEAVNRDLTARNETHLQGQITVLWFYPAAGTAG